MHEKLQENNANDDDDHNDDDGDLYEYFTVISILRD